MESLNDNHLLLDTLQIIWKNYLHSIHADHDIKQHWLQLFLYYFQFLETKSILTNNSLWKSFFKSIPEQIYSYFLEEIYNIITKSNETPLATIASETRASISLDKGDIENNVNYSQLLKKNYNFAQLILCQPSDFNKIVALRQFLTHQLGQHILQFFLHIDIKLLTSRESFCNLCINLFPNCPWKENTINELVPKPLNVDWKYNDQFKLQNNNQSKVCDFKKFYDIKSYRFQSEKYLKYEDFKETQKSSDEIAVMLICLLQKFTDFDDDDNNVINKERRSINLTVYTFTVQCLQKNNTTFSSPRNAACVKYQFLKLLTQCLNNFIMCVKKLDQEEETQLQHILQDLIHILEDNNNRELDKLLYSILHIIVTLIYNIVAVSKVFALQQTKCTHIFSDKVLNDDVIEKCTKMMYHLLMSYPPQREDDIKQLFTQTFKLYIDIIEELTKYNRLIVHQAKTINCVTEPGKQYLKLIKIKDTLLKHNKRRRRNSHKNQKYQRQHSYQIHCTLKPFTPARWACLLQKIFISIFHKLPNELQETTIIYLSKYGTCCCHYTLATYQRCFNVLQQSNLELPSHKHLYKFLDHKFLCTVYGGNNSKGNYGNISNKESVRHDIQCLQCYEKSHCTAFQNQLLQLYYQFYKSIQYQHGQFNNTLWLFLKHIKFSSQYFIYRPIANGIITDIVLPVFYQLKSLFINKNRSETTITEDCNVLYFIAECLNIFIIYLNFNDVNLIKGFYNNENVKHLADLWQTATIITTTTLLVYNVSELIKIGIEKLSNLNENQQEQQILKKYLITLQFHHTDYATQRFNNYMSCTMPSNINNIKEVIVKPGTETTRLNKDKVFLILNTLVLQWLLNYDLLNNCPDFYIEFIKIFQIAHNDIEVSDESVNNEIDEIGDIDGSHRFLNILQLNYYALLAFLSIPTTNGKCSKNSDSNATNKSTDNAEHSLENFAVTSTLIQTSSLKSIYPLEADNYFSLFSSRITLDGINSLTDNNVLMKAESKHSTTSVTPIDYLNYIEDNNETIIERDLLTLISSSFVKEVLLSCQPYQKYNYSSTIKLYSIKNQFKYSETPMTDNLNSFLYKGFYNSNNPLHVLCAEPQNEKSANHSASNNDTKSVVINNEKNTNDSNLFDKIFHVLDNLIPKFNYLLPIASITTVNPNEEKFNDYDLNGHTNGELYLFYSNDCKRLLLKLFEVTMAICLKGFDEPTEKTSNKIQQHLLKLKHVILSSASKNWENYAADDDSQENLVVRALQSLLKIAAEITEERSTKVMDTSQKNGNDALQQQISRQVSKTLHSNVASRKSNSKFLKRRSKTWTISLQYSQPAPMDIRNNNEYISRQNSFICADSELDISETEADDLYMTADDGYDADIELLEFSDVDSARDALNDCELWESYQPVSPYRLSIVHEGICHMVIEILIELSEHCCRHPNGWSNNLAQLINSLYVVRDCLGGTLFLLKGFSPILCYNDSRLYDLQQRILELIIDIKTPDVLTTLFGICGMPDPPIDVLVKFFHNICINTLTKMQPHLELEFIPKYDMKNILNVEPQTAFQIDFLREYHRHCDSITPLTRAPCIIPITSGQVWQKNGFTVSMWLQVKNDLKVNTENECSTNDDEANDNVGCKKTHVVSIGTDQAMLSIYLSDNMHLIFETYKPNQELSMPYNHLCYAENDINKDDYSSTATTNTKIFKALQQTKNILLSSLHNINIFNGPVLNSIDTINFRQSDVCLKAWRCQKNQWYHLTFSIKMTLELIDVITCVNGLEYYGVTVPFYDVLCYAKNYTFQLIALGDGCPQYKTKSTCTSSTPSKSSENYPISRIVITNIMLFNRSNFSKETILNLTAMGPDFTQLTECQVSNCKPNYGYLNLRKISNKTNINFGSFKESMKILQESRILCYMAQEPYAATVYNTTASTDPLLVQGTSNGLILYGEPKKTVITSLQSALILCGGLSNLLYFFARVVEKTSNSSSQAMALDILLKVAFSESQLYAEFHYNDYLNLIGYVIKTNRCTKDSQLLQSIINNSCSPSMSLSSKKMRYTVLNENTTALVIYPHLITRQLRRYSDWHRSGCEHCEPLELLLNATLALIREKHPYRDFNIAQLTKAGLIKDLLNLCKVYVIESPNPIFITTKAADYIINIISIFAGSPPTPSLLDEIMKLLLLLQKPSECFITHDRSKFYYLLTNEVPMKDKLGLATMTASFRKSSSSRNIITGRTHPGVAKSISNAVVSNFSTKNNNVINNNNDQNHNYQIIDDHLKRQKKIQFLRNIHKKKESYKTPIDDFLEILETNTNCCNLNKNALFLLNPKRIAHFKWYYLYKRMENHGKRRKHQPFILIPLKRRFSTLIIKKIYRNMNKYKINVRKRIRRRSNAKYMKDAKHQKKLLSSLHSLASSSNSTNIDWSDQTNASNTSTRTSSNLRSNQHSLTGILTKADPYSSVGLTALKTGLLLLLKDFLCLLPDTAVQDVLHHYIKIEFLLVLANHHDTGVRTAILKLIDTLTQRLNQQDLNMCYKHLYNYHLANQITINNVDVINFETCLTWVTNHLCNVSNLLLDNINLHIKCRFGLNTLIAIASKSTAPGIHENNEFSEQCFTILKKLFVNVSNDEKLLLIEAGLLQATIKALYALFAKGNNAYNKKTEENITDLLHFIGKYSIHSVGHINILWDIINMLAFYEQEKQAQFIIKKFRSIQARLQLNWLQLFFDETNVPWNFKVIHFKNSALSLTEINKRLELLSNRSTQFFTIRCEKSLPSHEEIELFKFLISYNIVTNQRCNHFIAWGLQPSQPTDLRSFIIDALWIACQDDFLPNILHDNKSIKALLWLSLLEDVQPPLKNLKFLCERLGIHEDVATWNLENELQKFQNNGETIKQRLYLEKTIYKNEILTQNCIESSMITTRKVAELQNSERKSLMNYMKDYNDTHLYTKWLYIIRRSTHEGAPWFNEKNTENSWELDDTEGPNRVHTRLRRCHLDLDKRFFMNDYRDNKDTVPPSLSTATEDIDVTFSRTTQHQKNTILHNRPLHYLTANYDQQLNISLNSQILYNFPAIYLPVEGEIDGEIIITDHMLHFIATHRCKYFYINCDITDITEIWLKRYQHKDTAFELYLDTNQSLFFTLQNPLDMKIMREVFCDKIITQIEQQNKLLQLTQHWCEGLLTNWEYLMSLNQMAGRTYNDLMQYPILPWILSNYVTNKLDLKDKQNFRNLQKPIAVQNIDNEQHYINNYMHIKNNETHIGSLPLQPYHYSSHYSNSGTVLHFLVRVPPFTSHFLRYQDNNFDIPDRTFHSLNTTWNLASRDSSTDVKELIPEFFCLPEMFENFENFNFGYRQNGERVNDVHLPPWCLRESRLFILIHRQALETELVRNDLHHWIDLIFGYKQTGDAAVEAINVFHPVTYPTILDYNISDPVERSAVETMIKTYGQMPRQLFLNPHPPSKSLHYESDDKQSILSNIYGLRWGNYVGSPQLHKPTLGYINKLPNADHLVSFNNTNVIYGLPKNYNIMQGPEIDTFNVISWDYPDNIIRIQSLSKLQYNSNTKGKNLFYNNNIIDGISACGCEPNSNQLWFGHKSGRLSVYKCNNLETNPRFYKSRQSYVRGLRLSYNSALRKIATKTSSAQLDLDNEFFQLNDRNFNNEFSSTTTMTSTTTSTLSSPRKEIGDSNNASHVGNNNLGVGYGVGYLRNGMGISLISNSTSRDDTDLRWHGPTVLIRHTDEVTCIKLSIEFKIAVSAAKDGLAVIWDLNNWSYIRTIGRPSEIHRSPITLVSISPTMGDIVTVHDIPKKAPMHNQNNAHGNNAETTDNSAQLPPDECFEVTEENLDDFINVSVNLNGKSTLRLHTINARYIKHIVQEERIMAVCYSFIKEGVGVNVIATAMEGGIIHLWSSWNLSYVNKIITGTSNIKSLTYSTHQYLVVLTQECYIQIWQTDDLCGTSPKFPQIVYR